MPSLSYGRRHAISFFRVAGLLPDGRVSGRYYYPVPKRRKHLVLDLSFPSKARVSDFTTSTTLARLASSEVFRVITISRTYSWEVLARCGPPPIPVDLSPFPPSAPPAVPLGWGDAEWNWPPPSSSRIDFPITPSRNLTHPASCLAEVTSYFSRHGTVPAHMSSDVGLDYADGLPYLSVFGE
jgi:hypothetical protein